MSRTTDSHFVDVSPKVIRSYRVQEAIKLSAAEECKEWSSKCLAERRMIEKCDAPNFFARQRRRAVRILHDMRSCISSSLLRLAGWILYKILSRIFSSVQVHKGQLEVLRRAADRQLPMIYLPMHRSHLDYILISFILYMNNIKPPLVAAGDNLSIPFFGSLLRGLGAFFIKRRFEPLGSTRKDHVYRAVLQEYMTENLKNGHSLEFFIEGGRSRSGKACMPRNGLLSIVIDAVLEGQIEDALIVPVGVSYEKLIDGNFMAEQLGQSKVTENFSLAAKAIWSRLRSNFGNVRVDFCMPFSIKEYLHTVTMNSSNRPVDALNDATSVALPCVACAHKSPVMLRALPVVRSVCDIEMVVPEDKRQAVKELAEHIVYDAFNSSALMSTNLLAFLFLTKFRKGGTINQLTSALDWLRDEIQRRKRDCGFTGDSLNAVRHAYTVLGKDLVAPVKLQMAWSTSLNKLNGSLNGLQSNGCNGTTGGGGGNGTCGDLIDPTSNKNLRLLYLKPTVKSPHVLELQYYGNICNSIFLLDSVLGKLSKHTVA